MKKGIILVLIGIFCVFATAFTIQHAPNEWWSWSLLFVFLVTGFPCISLGIRIIIEEI